MSSATLDKSPSNRSPQDELNFISCRSSRSIEIGAHITDYARLRSEIIRDQHHAAVSAIVGGFSAAAVRHPRIDAITHGKFENAIRVVTSELITNSIYYGMLGLSAAEKDALLQSDDSPRERDRVIEIINGILRNGSLRSNRSTVFLDVTQGYVSLAIEDGCAFPGFVDRWMEQKFSDSEDFVSRNGRGLMLMASYFDHAEILECSTALRLVKLLRPLSAEPGAHPSPLEIVGKLPPKTQ